MNINALPDDCLRLIFERLTLQQRVQLRHSTICIRWHLVLTQLLHGQRTLKLFGSYSSVQQYNQVLFEHNIDDSCDDLLVLANSNGNVSLCELPSVFPNLKSVLISRKEGFEHEIPGLLQKWTSKLDCLTLLDTFKKPEIIPLIWSSISQMNSLILLRLQGLFKNEIPQATFPILRQLKVFLLGQYIPDLLPILCELQTCFFLLLSWVTLSGEHLVKVLQVNPNLRVNLKILALGLISSPRGVDRVANFRKLFNFICIHFEQLEIIDILFAEHLPLCDLIPSLSNLPNLKQLRFYIGSDQLTDRDQDDEKEESAQANQQQINRLLPPLESVKSLYLEIFDLTLDQFYSRIPALFPNVEKLTLRCECYDSSEAGSVNFQFEETKMKEHFKCLKEYKFKL